MLVGVTTTAALVGQKYEAPLAKWASNTFGLGIGMMLINLLMAVRMSGWNGFQLGLMGKAASNLGRVSPYILLPNTGVNVNATSDEKITDIASNTENSVNRRPTMPSMNEIGKNTITNTSVVAITAKPTSRVPL